jgi:hypothetical protein
MRAPSMRQPLFRPGCPTLSTERRDSVGVVASQ